MDEIELQIGQVWRVNNPVSTVPMDTRIILLAFEGSEQVRVEYSGTRTGTGVWLRSSILTYCTYTGIRDRDGTYDHVMHNLQLVAENSSLVHNQIIANLGNISLEHKYTRKYFINLLKGCMAQEDHPIDHAQASIILYNLWDAWKREQEVINPSSDDGNQPTKEETTMSITDKLEQRAFIGEEDVSNQTDQFFFNRISKMEAEIKKLDAIENKPKKLVAKIDELRDEIKALVEHVDNR